MKYFLKSFSYYQALTGAQSCVRTRVARRNTGVQFDHQVNQGYIQNIQDRQTKRLVKRLAAKSAGP